MLRCLFYYAKKKMIWLISCSNSSNRAQEKNPASVLARLQKVVLFNIRSCVIARENIYRQNKKVSSIVKMEDHGQNLALFQQILCFSTPHRHLMGEYPVHLPALSGQVRVHIALQGDVGVGMS